MAMKNKDTWEFAHLYAGKIWVRMGSALFVISLGVMFRCGDRVQRQSPGWAVVLYRSVYPIAGRDSTDGKELRKVFDRDGNRIAE